MKCGIGGLKSAATAHALKIQLKWEPRIGLKQLPKNKMNKGALGSAGTEVRYALSTITEQ